MKIAVVGSEAAPFARTGGLGDVLGALPKALAELGHEVILFLPAYDVIDFLKKEPANPGWSGHVKINDGRRSFEILRLKERRLPLQYIFIKNDYYFKRPGLYVDSLTGRDYTDNDERFYFFNRAVLATLKKLSFAPEIIHLHDWPTALIPALLKYSQDDNFFAKTKTVLTVHNLAYQGQFPAERFKLLRLPPELMNATAPFEFYKKVNFLKGGLALCDKITTVSPRYAEEIQSSAELGCGLEGLLTERSKDLVGILNGVDYSIWSPSRDKKIPFRYHRANLGGKRGNKVELLKQSGLPVRDGFPLIGIVSRLVDQKGFDLFEEVAEDIFALPLQIVLLGSGDEKYHNLFLSYEKKYPDRLRAYVKFDDGLAHLIEAGADMFLMPSRFEPCGLSQMYSLKYGTVPIVRETGGLADTVKNYNETTGEGNGFVFKEYKAAALLAAIKRALSFYHSRRTWIKIVKAGMACDFSWKSSAAKYDKLFSQIK